MQRFRQFLRTCLILALIPLTVWSGRVAPGCICSDGHFEPLCDGEKCNCCSSNDATHRAGGCAKCRTKTAASGHRKACCSHNREPDGIAKFPDRDCPGGCCHPLSLSPMVTEKNSTPQLDVEHVAFVEAMTVVKVPDVVNQLVPVRIVDYGPQSERLKLIQSLLL